MQEKTITRAKIILDGLRKYYEIRTYGDLAKFLGVKQNTLSSWISRDSIDEDLIYRKCDGISYEWLKTGEGEMFVVPHTYSDQLKGFSPEIKLLADYLEVKLKGKTAEERLKYVEEVMEEIRRKNK